MEFTFKKCSDSKFEQKVELSSLDDLLKFIESQPKSCFVGEDKSIILYDDYIE